MCLHRNTESTHIGASRSIVLPNLPGPLSAQHDSHVIMCSLIDIVTTFYDAFLVMLEPSKRWNIQSACTYLYTSGQSLFFFHVVSHDPHCLVDDMSLSIDNKSKLRMISLSLSLCSCKQNSNQFSSRFTHMFDSQIHPSARGYPSLNCSITIGRRWNSELFPCDITCDRLAHVLLQWSVIEPYKTI